LLCAGILLAAIGAQLMTRGQQIDHLAELDRQRRQRETQREDAATAWRSFQSEMKTAQFLLYTRTTEPEQLADGVAVARKLVERYGVLDDPNWQQAALARALPDADRQQLGDSMGELLLLLARALIVQHGDRPAENNNVLQEAQIMNERAVACSPAAETSPALWRQRAKLHALHGRAADARACQ